MCIYFFIYVLFLIMQKTHAHITLEEKKAILNLCTKLSNPLLKIFPSLLKISFHFSFITLVTGDGSSRINFLIIVLISLLSILVKNDKIKI